MKIILETLKGNIKLEDTFSGLLITKLNSPYLIQFEMDGLFISDIDKIISKDNLSRMIEYEMEYLIDIEEKIHMLTRKKNSWKSKLKNLIELCKNTLRQKNTRIF